MAGLRRQTKLCNENDWHIFPMYESELELRFTTIHKLLNNLSQMTLTDFNSYRKLKCSRVANKLKIQ